MIYERNNKMKKLIALLLTSTLLITLTACGSNTPVVITSLSDNLAEDEVVSVDCATEDFLSNYDSFDEFIDYKDEYSQRIVFSTNSVIKDFKYIEIGHKEEDAGIVYFENAVLYSLDELLPENPFVTTWTEVGDVISYRGIAFTDDNNVTKYFYIKISGEDGTLLLIEFQPTQHKL